MHRQIHIMFTCAKKAKDIHEYKNIIDDYIKLLQPYGTMKTCRDKHLSPEYISIESKAETGNALTR